MADNAPATTGSADAAGIDPSLYPVVPQTPPPQATTNAPTTTLRVTPTGSAAAAGVDPSKYPQVQQPPPNAPVTATGLAKNAVAREVDAQGNVINTAINPFANLLGRP